jgi:hypothetical protein
MLRMFRRDPLLVGTAEVLLDAVRYIAIVLLVLVVFAPAIKLVF